MKLNDLKRIIIVCGHYGCGKTNFSLNLALDIAKQGRAVTLIDLDVVNPYFRSSDYQEVLKKNGVDVIAPVYAGTNVDTPALSPKIDTVLDSDNSSVLIFDVGGDDAGAFALGRYASKIKSEGYSFIYVVNKYRNLISTPELALGVLGEIMCACGLEPDCVVNNSHLQNLTTAETITEALDYGNEVARKLEVPLLCTTAPNKLMNDKKLENYNLYYVEPIVKPPFGQQA